MHNNYEQKKKKNGNKYTLAYLNDLVWPYWMLQLTKKRRK